MSGTTETSDAALVDLLRQAGALGVTEMADATGVTATAVRQRLARMMSQGLIERTASPAGRGRPSHRYSLTSKGQRYKEVGGTNYADLAGALWSEIRSIQDPDVRRGLLQRIVSRLSEGYVGQVSGDTLEQRMESLVELMGERKIPFKVERPSGLPVLTALACPYPDLAKQDRSVCAMEKMLFSEMLGTGIRLTECRLDGAMCCTFEAS
jgi:predicted ArsR family transcriptional regulator